MKPSQMIAMVRKLIADEQGVGFSLDAGSDDNPQGTQELRNYVNRAVDEYSKCQAGNKDVRLMKEKELHDGDTLPEDYIAFCGAMPIKVIGKKVKFYISSNNAIPVRYFARLAYPEWGNTGDDYALPYDEDQYIAICALAAIYALNKHEYAVSQDLTLLGYGGSNADKQSAS